MSKLKLELEPDKPKFGWVIVLLVVGIAGYYLLGNKQVSAPVERVREIVKEYVPSIDLVGGDIETNVSRFSNGLVIGSVQQSWVSGQIPAGTSSVAWTNNLSDSVIIDPNSMYMYNLDVASSSLMWTVATSTNATSSPTSFPDLSHITGVFIDNYLVGTSSKVVLRATTTAPIVLASGKSIIFRVEAMGVDCGGAQGSAVMNRSCSSATSTDRGYNPFFKFRYIKHKAVF